MTAADDDLAGVVADGVDVDLGGVLEEAVDQHRPLGRQPALLARGEPKPASSAMARAQAVVVVDDLHGPAAEHVGRAARAPGSRCASTMARASSTVVAVPPAGWGISSRAHRAFHRSRSSARSIDAGAGAEHQLGRQRAPASFSGVWPPSATITPASSPAACSASMTLMHVLVGERLEVEAVGGVVVGRHRLGVAVDHDRLEAGVAQGEAGVDAAVVELDALADAVGARAEDDHLAAVAGRDLVLVLVGRVVVRRLGLELGAAGVDGLERRLARRPPSRAARTSASSARPTARPAGRRRSRAAWPAASRAGSCRSKPTARPGGPAPRRSCRIWSRNHGSTLVRLGDLRRR